jgi:hypothetical protein
MDVFLKGLYNEHFTANFISSVISSILSENTEHAAVLRGQACLPGPSRTPKFSYTS